jgi:hypothetical protein
LIVAPISSSLRDFMVSPNATPYAARDKNHPILEISMPKLITRIFPMQKQSPLSLLPVALST